MYLVVVAAAFRLTASDRLGTVCFLGFPQVLIQTEGGIRWLHRSRHA